MHELVKTENVSFARVRLSRYPEGTLLVTACNEYAYVGRGGTLVESIPFNQRVVGSNLALAAM